LGKTQIGLGALPTGSLAVVTWPSSQARGQSRPFSTPFIAPVRKLHIQES